MTGLNQYILPIVLAQFATPGEAAKNYFCIAAGIISNPWKFGCKGPNTIPLIVLPYLCNTTRQQRCDKTRDLSWFRYLTLLGNIYNVTLFQGSFPYSLNWAYSFVLYILHYYLLGSAPCTRTPFLLLYVPNLTCSTHFDLFLEGLLQLFI